MEYILIAGLAYVVLDWILAITYGRCVLPGLKCPVCRKED